MLPVDTLAPSFTAQDQIGKTHSLSDYQERWLLLYFYPKDNTPGCTKEACTIRDSFQNFNQLGIAVLGVSADSPSSHQDFANKHHLPFPLLSDPDKKIIRSYDALGTKNIFGKKVSYPLRISYLINPQGKIAKSYQFVQPAKHAHEVLADQPKL